MALVKLFFTRGNKVAGELAAFRRMAIRGMAVAMAVILLVSGGMECVRLAGEMASARLLSSGCSTCIIIQT